MNNQTVKKEHTQNTSKRIKENYTYTQHTHTLLFVFLRISEFLGFRYQIDKV